MGLDVVVVNTGFVKINGPSPKSFNISKKCKSSAPNLFLLNDQILLSKLIFAIKILFRKKILMDISILIMLISGAFILMHRKEKSEAK